MMYRFSNFSHLIVSALMMMLVNPCTAIAQQATNRPTASSEIALVTLTDSIFTPYLAEIQRNLPPGWVMRLPNEINLSNATEAQTSQYQVQIIPFNQETGLTINLVSCQEANPSCLVGSFNVNSQDSEIAQQSFKQHQAAASWITFKDNLRVYSRENPQNGYSSAMWQQDGLFYTVQFPSSERQNTLYMALAMTQATPISQNSPLPVATNPSNANTSQTSPATVDQQPSPNSENEQTSPTEGINNENVPLPETSSQNNDNNAEQEPITTEYCQIPPNLEPATPLEIPLASGNSLSLSKIRLVDNTLLQPDDLNSIINSLQQQQLNPQLFAQKLTDNINTLYQEQGYLTSKAKLTSLNNGIVEIQVIEGRITEIQVQGRKRLNLSYICNRLKLGLGIPFNALKLEDQLKLLKIDPKFKELEASLRSTNQEGQTMLLLTIAESSPIHFNLGSDNYSPPSVGSEEFNIGFTVPNVTGMGDALTGNYWHTFTGGSDQFDFSYEIPVSSNNSAIKARFAYEDQEITQEPLNELDIGNTQETYELSYNQFLIRNPRQELSLSFGFSFIDNQSFVFDDIGFPFTIGPDENGISRTSVFQIGQNYISRNPSGVWALRSQFNIGTGLFDATINDAPIPDGNFFSWLGQIQRVQILNRNNFLLIQGDIQLTPDSLLPIQQFTIGGANSVRGYRQNARSGDNGFRFSIENRTTLARNREGFSKLQLAPFVDMGLVWNAEDNPNYVPDQTFLIGAGLSLLWEIEKDLNLRLDYGFPFIDLKDRGENAQDDGFYFGIQYKFP